MSSARDLAWDPLNLQTLSREQLQHAYRVARGTSIVWAALRVLSLPFLMLAAAGAAYETGHDVFSVPVIGWLAAMAIILAPLLVLGVIGTDVLSSMTSRVVAVAGEVMRLTRPTYEEDSIPEEVGRRMNITVDVADAGVIGRDGSRQSLEELIGCRSFHVFGLVRRRLSEGEVVLLLGVEAGHLLLVRFRPRR